MSKEMPSIFTPSEQNDLDQLRNYRMAMIQEAFKDGTPADSKTMRVINELLTSQESAITTTASIRVKQEAAKSDTEIKETIANIFKEHANKMSSLPTRDLTVEVELVTDELEPPIFVPGETSDVQEQIDFHSIMGDDYNG